MDNYTVEIWESQTKSEEYGRPTFIFNNIVATSPEMALRRVLQENNIHIALYAEVIWNNGHDRQKFENYSL